MEHTRTYQSITSAKTSIKQVPALHKSRYVAEVGQDATVLDYGAGKYPELAEKYLKSIVQIAEYTPYDPYNLPGRLITDKTFKTFDMVLCSNVLNVIYEDDVITGIIRNVICHTRKGGHAFFTVYEGDQSGNGRITTKGYQRNERTQRYMAYILKACPWVHLERKGKIIIVHV